MGWLRDMFKARAMPVERDTDLIRETSALRIEQRARQNARERKLAEFDDLARRTLDLVKRS